MPVHLHGLGLLAFDTRHEVDLVSLSQLLSQLEVRQRKEEVKQ